MSLTFAFKDEQELLEKLSDSDYELTRRDLIMFGMHCVEEVDGKARRVDVQHVELHNGRMTRFSPMRRTTGELITADMLKTPMVSPIIEDQQHSAKRWMNIYRNALRDLIDTSSSPIWKKHDPGAV